MGKIIETTNTTEATEENIQRLDITDQLADSGKDILVVFCRQQKSCIGCYYNRRNGCVVRVPKDWPEGD